MHAETYVGNDTEKIRLVLLIHSHRIVEIRRKEDLRTRTFHVLLLLLVQGLLQELGALLEHHSVKLRKVCGIVSYGVLDQKDALHTDLQDVIVGILEILEKLDYGHDKVGISMPAEHVVNGRSVKRRKPSVHFLGEMRQEHEREASAFFLEVRGKSEDVVVSCIVHAYDHIDTDSSLKHFAGFSRSLRPQECRRSTQVKIDILFVDTGFNLSVLFKDERVIVAADHQDSSYTKSHK